MWGRTGPSLRVWSHPLPLTGAESLQLDTVLAVLAAIFVLVPLCYLAGMPFPSPLPFTHRMHVMLTRVRRAAQLVCGSQRLRSQCVLSRVSPF